MYYNFTHLPMWPPYVLGALQKTSCLNDVSCSYESHLFDFEHGEICKKMSDFRLISAKTV